MDYVRQADAVFHKKVSSKESIKGNNTSVAAASGTRTSRVGTAAVLSARHTLIRT